MAGLLSFSFFFIGELVVEDTDAPAFFHFDIDDTLGDMQRALTNFHFVWSFLYS